jgi:hypothetical protein
LIIPLIKPVTAKTDIAAINIQTAYSTNAHLPFFPSSTVCTWWTFGSKHRGWRAGQCAKSKLTKRVFMHRSPKRDKKTVPSFIRSGTASKHTNYSQVKTLSQLSTHGFSSWSNIIFVTSYVPCCVDSSTHCQSSGLNVTVISSSYSMFRVFFLNNFQLTVLKL